jgi:hypothetical protein
VTTITQIETICDLCGSHKEPLAAWAKLTMPQRSKLFVPSIYDICPACVASLQAQIEERRIDRAAKPRSEMEHNPSCAG